MELVLTTDDGLRIGIDVVEGGYVYLRVTDTFVKWESLTSEEQAKWLEAQSRDKPTDRCVMSPRI